MQQALRMIVRGPAAWILALAIAVGLTELGNAVHASHAVAQPTPAPQFFLAVSGPSTITDRRTGMRLAIEAASIQQMGQAAPHRAIRILVHISLANRSRHTARYSEGDFHILDGSGQAYSPAESNRGGRLSRSRSVTSVLTFVVPGAPSTYFVVWDDGGKLMPPALLERISIRRAR